MSFRRNATAALMSLLALPVLAGACGLGPFGDWDRNVTPPPDDVAEAKRAQCAYRPGALPAETQGSSHPNGNEIPLEHIIVLMQENRSFDHYFQKLPEYGQPDVEVAPPEYFSPDRGGIPIFPYHMTEDCFVDTVHTWADVHAQIDGGKMDGFVKVSESQAEDPITPGSPLSLLSGTRAMGYYDADDIPFYYWLANEFAIADHYHASVPGPTVPNRMFLLTGSSFGLIRNTKAKQQRTIFDNLEVRGISYRIYADLTPGAGLFLPSLANHVDAIHPLSDLLKDIQSDSLASVSYVDPILGHHGFQATDEHPPAMASVGQAYVAKLVDALTKSDAWSSSVMFLTYDEHGGLFDHVPPPPACVPDSSKLDFGPGDPHVGFEELGVRVPLIAISPFAKKHFVGHHVYDHTSVLRFIEARYILPAMSGRDANAEAPWELFDFDKPPHENPPHVKIPVPDPQRVSVCERAFPM